MAREPGERWTCTCGTALVGALTINGKVAPIELEPTAEPLVGNVWLGRGPGGRDDVRCATLGGPLLEQARRHGMVLHMNHWATCPDREQFNQRRRR